MTHTLGDGMMKIVSISGHSSLSENVHQTLTKIGTCRIQPAVRPESCKDKTFCTDTCMAGTSSISNNICVNMRSRWISGFRGASGNKAAVSSEDDTGPNGILRRQHTVLALRLVTDISVLLIHADTTMPGILDLPTIERNSARRSSSSTRPFHTLLP